MESEQSRLSGNPMSQFTGSAANGNESQKQSKQWICREEWRILIDQISNVDPSRSPASVVSIFRVPNFLKKSGGEEAYVPQIVSLGPYHHRNAQLPPMNNHKGKALGRMMKRIGSNNYSPSCVEAEILKVENDIRVSYEEIIECEAEKLAMMLCLDGCFILEILRTLWGDELPREEAGEWYEPICGDELPGEEAGKWYEPIFERNRIAYTGFDILCDILKLENQVPLIVLRKLLQLELNSNDGQGEISGWLVKCVSATFYPFVLNDVSKWESQDHHKQAPHLLGLLHSLIVSAPCPHVGDPPAVQKKPDDMLPRQQSEEHPQSLSQPLIAGSPPCPHVDQAGPDDNLRRIPRAAKLRNAGIEFEACKGGIEKIRFEPESGKIFLPPINITDYTEVLFRNLIAMELCKPSDQTNYSSHAESDRSPRANEKNNYVKWYVKLMDELIDAEEDVGVLTESGIIMNYLGSDAEVARLFNVLCNGVTLSQTDPFLQTKQQVDKHYKSKFKVWSAELIKNHFSSPWTILALVGAILALLLTLLQTIYTIIAYYK